ASGGGPCLGRIARGSGSSALQTHVEGGGCAEVVDLLGVQPVEDLGDRPEREAAGDHDAGVELGDVPGAVVLAAAEGDVDAVADGLDLGQIAGGDHHRQGRVERRRVVGL